MTKEECAKAAHEHETRMNSEYIDDIIRSVAASKAYEPSMLEDREYEPVKSRQLFINQDTVNALFSINDYEDAKPVCILNFASYKYPGGMFMNGSYAQEEALCHSSTLYNVLCGFENRTGYYEQNRKQLNRGLYTHRAIYSKDILFFDPLGKDAPLKADVISCAAPNRSILEKYHSFSDEENEQMLRERIRFIRKLAEENGVKTLILGAWGCGVFRQDAKMVARLMNKEFSQKTAIRNIVYALPGQKDNDYNTQSFIEILLSQSNEKRMEEIKCEN
ncbi:MAG: TIGR02452 family protein [Erysipelotrichaceae bacterium]|nr:TIGR02452 family protein [Erysipelotrichaceae bacterium]